MKKLSLEQVTESENYVVFVAKQSHYWEDFGDGRNDFMHDGVRLVSEKDCIFPGWSASRSTLFLPDGNDLVHLTVVLNGDWIRLQAAVAAYNHYFKDKPITETIKIQFGDRSETITRFIAAPPLGTNIFVVAGLDTIYAYPYYAGKTAYPVHEGKLVFPTGRDAEKFLSVFKVKEII